MSLFSSKQKRVSLHELEMLAAYARLAEQLGPETISRGVDAALLPAGKNELRDIIARVFRQRSMTRKLKPDDLTRLYGMLELFLPQEDIEKICAARALEGADTLAESEHQVVDIGLSVLERAVHEFHNAGEKLRSHAASLD